MRQDAICCVAGVPDVLTEKFFIMSTIITLFTYGGGMRGLIPARFMSRVEETTGLRIADMVDIFTGPSSGAILNAAMALPDPHKPGKPKYRARHLVRFYEREGVNIFPPDSSREFRGFIHDFNNRTMKISQLNWLLRHGHYDAANLGRALRSLYGRARIGDSLKSLIISAYDIEGGHIKSTGETVKSRNSEDTVHSPDENYFINEGGKAIWFKKMAFPGALLEHRNTPDVSLYDAVMSSCAAPSYFPCHNFRIRKEDNSSEEFACIDGCMFDNPCISYMGAVRPHLPPHTRHIMIVLGTGYTFKSIRKEEWNRYGALGVVDPGNDLPLINILFHASESALMDAFADEAGENLFIFNKIIPASPGPTTPSEQIDDASPANIKKLNLFFEEMMEENQSRFDDLCNLLVSHYDDRKKSGRKFFRTPWGRS